MTIEAPTLAPALHSATLVLRRLPGDRSPVLRRSEPPHTPLSWPLWPLVQLPPPTTLVAPTRASVGAAAPPVEVSPTGVAGRTGCHSTIPGLAHLDVAGSSL
jgi:hypothetical protein